MPTISFIFLLIISFLVGSDTYSLIALCLIPWNVENRFLLRSFLSFLFTTQQQQNFHIRKVITYIAGGARKEISSLENIRGEVD